MANRSDGQGVPVLAVRRHEHDRLLCPAARKEAEAERLEPGTYQVVQLRHERGSTFLLLYDVTVLGDRSVRCSVRLSQEAHLLLLAGDSLGHILSGAGLKLLDAHVPHPWACPYILRSAVLTPMDS